MTSLFDVTDNDDILALQPRLTDDDPGVRRIALIELADLEEPDGLLWLVNRLAEDPTEEVRAEAARLLEAWEDESVVEALCQALTDPSLAVQSAAAQSLSLLKKRSSGEGDSAVDRACRYQRARRGFQGLARVAFSRGCLRGIVSVGR